ncbi:hypothetical protein F8M41_002567 [Gigaspora margarita]|uniref:Uncharacterized protein n=1 Tax=Gigaspora margarita TaxID=4874 RepID=A0A8H4AYQ6_GIGMA|nr:hypothetical protein F8M41_002567 [Gigaspora margarita]
MSIINFSNLQISIRLLSVEYTSAILLDVIGIKSNKINHIFQNFIIRIDYVKITSLSNPITIPIESIWVVTTNNKNNPTVAGGDENSDGNFFNCVNCQIRFELSRSRDGSVWTNCKKLIKFLLDQIIITQSIHFTPIRNLDRGTLLPEIEIVLENIRRYIINQNEQLTKISTNQF